MNSASVVMLPSLRNQLRINPFYMETKWVDLVRMFARVVNRLSRSFLAVAWLSLFLFCFRLSTYWWWWQELQRHIYVERSFFDPFPTITDTSDPNKLLLDLKVGVKFFLARQHIACMLRVLYAIACKIAASQNTAAPTPTVESSLRGHPMAVVVQANEDHPQITTRSIHTQTNLRMPLLFFYLYISTNWSSGTSSSDFNQGGTRSFQPSSKKFPACFTRDFGSKETTECPKQNLRPRAHSLTLPDKHCALDSCNFVTRMLYGDCYWHVTVISFFFLVMSAAVVCHLHSKRRYILYIQISVSIPTVVWQ